MIPHRFVTHKYFGKNYALISVYLHRLDFGVSQTPTLFFCSPKQEFSLISAFFYTKRTQYL